MASTATKITTGLGIAAVVSAAAAAASHYFFGKNGRQHKKQLKTWVKKAKAEMVEKISRMNDVSKKAYDKAAKEVMAKYKQAKNVKPQELAAFGSELKKHWNKISKDISALGRKKATAR